MAKKIKLALVALTVMALPIAALAVNNAGIPNTSGGGAMDLNTLVNTVLGKIWVLFVGLAVVMFLYAGVLFLTAGGAPEKIATARQAFLWGVVGIVVGIISYSIILIVGSLIGS